MKIVFEKWWDKNTKCINLISYKDAWDKPHFLIHSNDVKRKNGDTCFDFNVDLGYLHFSYTNWDLQGHMKNKTKVEEILKSKPTKEQIFNSVTLDKSYYEKSCKQQIELAKKQEKERNELKPTDELYKMKFDI